MKNAKMNRLRNHYRSALFCTSVLLGLWLVSKSSYLLFHGIAEIFSIVVAFAIFVLAWNSRHYAQNSYLLFVGIAYLFVAGFDLLHMLAYKGMGVFPRGGSDLATRLWVSARYIQSISLLCAVFLTHRRLRVGFVLLAYGFITSLLLALIFYWNVFPKCFVEGQGLTAFKIASEYVICLLLLVSILLLLRQRREFEPLVLYLLIASMAVTIASELVFTFYKTVEGFPNLLGHYFKIVSFYLIYKAIIVTGLTKPFTLLLRDLKKSEEALKATKENLEIEVGQRTAELRRSQQELESRVRDRTAELEQAKETLEQEIAERRAAEEKFRNLAEQSPDMIFIIRESKLAYVNRRCEEILGYKKQEFCSADFDYLAMFAPESRPIKEANFRKHMKGEDVLPVEYTLLTRTGAQVSAITTTKLIDYEGQRAILVTATDISWRKQAEEELRRAHDQWERTFEAVPDLICILDRSHRVLRVNKAVANRLACTPEDLIGRHCYEVIHGCNTPVSCCPHLRLLADGEEHWAEMYEQRLGGHFSICVTPLHNADGEPIGAVHVAHDITQRKAAEEALRRSEHELAIRNKIAQVFLTLSDGEMYSQVLHVVLEAMKSKHGVFGYINDDGAYVCPSMTRDVWDQCGMVEKDYIFPREAWGGVWGRAMTEKKTLCLNYPFTVPQGHIPIERAMDVPLIYQGRVIGNLLVANKATDYDEGDRDLLEMIAAYVAPILAARLDTDRWEKQRREALEALQKARDELEMREQRTSELAKSREALWRLTGRLLSVQEEERRRLARELHDDLTQRLAVLAIDAGKLEQQMGSAPDGVRARIAQMKEQMVKLSSDVHDISRQLHPSIIDDLGLKQALQSECVNFTRREGIAITYECEDIAAKIPRDVSICLFRIAQEGLRNIARHAKVKQAHVRLAGGNGSVTLTIEDSGVGFDTVEGRSQAGLGLVSMEERVRLIRGALHVKSKPGEGTTITVTAHLSGEQQ